MRLFPLVPTALAAVLAFSGLSGTAWSASEDSALRQLKSPVTSDATLGKLMGKWIGEGVVRQSAGGSEEPVKCRLTSTWAAENKLMRMMLACRGIDYVFTATSFIGRSGSVYRGSLNSSVNGEANVAGKRTGNGLWFNMVGNSDRGPVKSNLSLVIAGNQVTNTVQRTDPDTGQSYTALQVTMKK